MGRLKYKEYYYVAKKEEVSHRNNSTPLWHYGWTISNKKGEVLQEATELQHSKEDAEQDARDHIDEMYY